MLLCVQVCAPACVHCERMYTSLWPCVCARMHKYHACARTWVESSHPPPAHPTLSSSTLASPCRSPPIVRLPRRPGRCPLALQQEAPQLRPGRRRGALRGRVAPQQRGRRDQARRSRGCRGVGAAYPLAWCRRGGAQAPGRVRRISWRHVAAWAARRLCTCRWHGVAWLGQQLLGGMAVSCWWHGVAGRCFLALAAAGDCWDVAFGREVLISF